jgi:Phasin protein
MARSTEPKRAAVAPRTPAKRTPAHSKPTAVKAVEAARPERREDLAASPVESEGIAAGSEIAAVTEAVGDLAALPAEHEAGAPATAGAAEVGVAAEAPAVESAPSAARPEPEPEAVPEPAASAPIQEVAPAPAPAVLAMPWSRPGVVESAIDIHGRMVAFACRQTECSLAAGRALLASRSLPEMVSLQGQFVGKSVENTLAHALELTRLSAEMLSEGLRSARPR